MANKPKSRRRGGFLGIGSLVNQAAVPFTLVALQNKYPSKSRQGGKSRKSRRTRRRRH